MDTRILRMAERAHVTGLRHVRGLGQLQPVQFAINRNGRVTLAIEGIDGNRWCWWKLPLPWNKAKAKSLFGELEAHKAAGTEGPAARLWREYQETREQTHTTNT